MLDGRARCGAVSPWRGAGPASLPGVHDCGKPLQVGSHVKPRLSACALDAFSAFPKSGVGGWRSACTAGWLLEAPSVMERTDANFNKEALIS